MKVLVIAGFAESLLNFRGPLLAAMVDCGALRFMWLLPICPKFAHYGSSW